MEPYSDLLNSCLDSLKTYNTLTDKYLKNNDREVAKTNIKKIVKQYCQTDFDVKKSTSIAQESIKEFEQKLNLDDTTIKTELPDYNQLDAIYNRRLKEDRSVLGNVETHDIWKDIMTGVSNRDVEAVENNTADDVLPESAFEQMSDSLMCSNVFTPPIDPISKVVIRDPYRNKICRHVYEHKSILQYIKSMKNKAKCPYMGCNNNKMAVRDLQKDDNMRKRIDDYIQTREQSPDSS